MSVVFSINKHEYIPHLFSDDHRSSVHLWTPGRLPEVRLQDGTRGEALVSRWWIGEVIYFSAADDTNLDQMIDSDNCWESVFYLQ